ncbi:MAG: oligosaccharide flippase family protein [Tardiphaga sp.]
MAATCVVEVLNCLCLRRGQLRAFAIGRFISPASMAASQVSFGFLQLGSDSMVVAHILSQLVPILFLTAKLFTWTELREVMRVPWSTVLRTARGEYKFPLFDMPATVLCFAIINLPAILIGALFGTSMAGHFGVASRLFSSPISLIALPLSNVFVADATNGKGDAARYKSAVLLVMLAGAIITLPALLIGATAPYFVTMLLGPDWALTGRLMTALALMGAAQALSTPVQEVPTLLRRQGLRLWVDVARTILVFAPILLGVYEGWDPVVIVCWMSAGGATGYLARTAICLWLLRRAAQQADVAPLQPLNALGFIRTETKRVV